MEEFDEWNVVKKETNTKNTEILIDEGDIRWCKFGLNIGNETYGKGKTFSRPVLVIRKFSSDVFWGVPLTSKEKNGSWYFYIKQVERTAILNQLRLLDRKRLEERIFLISKIEVERIKDKIISLLKS
jgi:mRNA interferase MazF